jgi:hypothetical protein
MATKVSVRQSWPSVAGSETARLVFGFRTHVQQGARAQTTAQLFRRQLAIGACSSSDLVVGTLIPQRKSLYREAPPGSFGYKVSAISRLQRPLSDSTCSEPCSVIGLKLFFLPNTFAK